MLRVTLPWPPSELRPNAARRRHYHANAATAAKYKADCYVAILEQGINPADGPLSLTITFHPPTRRKYDRDGSLSAIKAGLDILAAHLGIDDDDFEPITLCRGGVIKGGAVEIVISEGDL